MREEVRERRGEAGQPKRAVCAVPRPVCSQGTSIDHGGSPELWTDILRRVGMTLGIKWHCAAAECMHADTYTGRKALGEASRKLSTDEFIGKTAFSCTGHSSLFVVF